MLKTLFLLIGLTASAFGYGAVTGDCMKGGQRVSVLGAQSSQLFIQSFSACTVAVYDNGTTNLTTIYEDNDATPKANPFVADAYGAWSFYTSDGDFTITMTGGGITGSISIPATVTGSVTSNVSVTPIANGIPQANSSAIVDKLWIFLSGSATIAPGALSDGTCPNLGTTITVTGAVTGKQAFVTPTVPLAAGLYALAKVTGTNTVTVAVCNHSGGSVTPPSTTYTAFVLP